MIDHSELKELQDTVGNLTRVGIVSAVDVAKAAVQVVFNDADEMVSNWLPVLQMYAHKNKFYALPDVGEQVLCMFLASGLENGFVIGSFYSDEDTPPVSDKDKYHMKFEDGTTIEYDRNAHKLTAEVKGDLIAEVDGKVELTCPTLKVDCPDSTFTGKVTIENGLVVSGGGANAVKVNGRMQATDVATDEGVSLDEHVHGGVESGDKTSGVAR